VRAQRGGRHAGQLVIGSVIGLYFTPEMIHPLISNAGLLVIAAVYAVLLSYVGGFVLSRISGVDKTTAFFSSVPGGAAEMTILGEHFGAKPDRIAMAQSLRVLLVVLIIPSVVTYAGFIGHDQYHPYDLAVQPVGLAAMFLLCGASGFLLSRFRLPNSYMLGPLFVSILLSITGHPLSAIPRELIVAAQILLGCDLGSRFTPEFRRESPRFFIGVAFSALCTMALSALLGLGMGYFAHISVATMILATAPGGIAEMSVTAKVLKLGVPLVTSFQVARLVILLTITAPLRRLFTTIKNYLLPENVKPAKSPETIA